jgi:hypothetical protein
VPIILTAAKLTRIGRQPVSVGAGVRHYADSPDGGPHGWGARLIVTSVSRTEQAEQNR